MYSKKWLYYTLLIIVAFLYIIEWFTNNVFLRILAGIVLIAAVAILPVTKK